ncbi:hypothetical protein X975_06343, partial [Stegodyphus mimosarum]
MITSHLILAHLFSFLSNDKQCVIRLSQAIVWLFSIPNNNVISKLQDFVSDIEDCCRKWRISINALKYKLLLVMRLQIQKTTLNILCLFGKTVNRVNNINYLGFMINQSLNGHIKRIIRKSLWYHQPMFSTPRKLLWAVSQQYNNIL